MIEVKVYQVGNATYARAGSLGFIFAPGRVDVAVLDPMSIGQQARRRAQRLSGGAVGAPLSSPVPSATR
jgi:hypothetical protein